MRRVHCACRSPHLFGMVDDAARRGAKRLSVEPTSGGRGSRAARCVWRTALAREGPRVAGRLRHPCIDDAEAGIPLREAHPQLRHPCIADREAHVRSAPRRYRQAPWRKRSASWPKGSAPPWKGPASRRKRYTPRARSRPPRRDDRSVRENGHSPGAQPCPPPCPARPSAGTTLRSAPVRDLAEGVSVSCELIPAARRTSLSSVRVALLPLAVLAALASTACGAKTDTAGPTEAGSPGPEMDGGESPPTPGRPRQPPLGPREAP